MSLFFILPILEGRNPSKKVHFLGDLKTPKFLSEINWPLLLLINYLYQDKGPFKYYFIMFLTFLGPPTLSRPNFSGNSIFFSRLFLKILVLIKLISQKLVKKLGSLGIFTKNWRWMLLLVAGEELAEKLLLRASSKLCKVEKERPHRFCK